MWSFCNMKGEKEFLNRCGVVNSSQFLKFLILGSFRALLSTQLDSLSPTLLPISSFMHTWPHGCTADSSFPLPSYPGNTPHCIYTHCEHHHLKLSACGCRQLHSLQFPALGPCTSLWCACCLGRRDTCTDESGPQAQVSLTRFEKAAFCGGIFLDTFCMCVGCL